jgi:hypothetical protein
MRIKSLVTALVLLFSFSSSQAEGLPTVAPVDIPASIPLIKISVGGFLGPSFSIETSRDKIIYTKRMDKVPEIIEIKPTPEAYAAYKKALDEINIWGWTDTYFNPNVRDGTQWDIEISYTDKTIKASGSNAYPDETGKSNQSPTQTAYFAKFMEATKALIGGKELY